MAYIDPTTVCSAWVTGAEVCACPDATVVDCATDTPTALTYPFTDDELALAASNYLFQKTCYRYNGICESTFYPCVGCNCSGLHPCGCGIYRAIPLGLDAPVRAVTNVTINGDVLDPGAYRVDDYTRLVRIDGECWPACNNLDASGGVSGDSMIVTVEYGIEPPVLLKMAALEMVCQFKKACEGQPCELDTSAISALSRRGTTVQIDSVIDLVAKGLTGNRIVDQALSVYGDCATGRGLLDPFDSISYVNVNTSIP